GENQIVPRRHRRVPIVGIGPVRINGIAAVPGPGGGGERSDAGKRQEECAWIHRCMEAGCFISETNHAVSRNIPTRGRLHEKKRPSAILASPLPGRKSREIPITDELAPGLFISSIAGGE